jgi:hypothetical protein
VYVYRIKVKCPFESHKGIWCSGGIAELILDQVSGQSHGTADLPLGNSSRHPTNKRMDVLHGRSGDFGGDSLVLAGDRSRITPLSSPHPSHYTD